MNTAKTLSAVACLLGVVACGNSDTRAIAGVPEPPTKDGGHPVPPKRHDAGLPASCAEGALRSCSHDLGSHDGVHSCAPASQVCANGAWGPCDGPVLVDGGVASAL